MLATFLLPLVLLFQAPMIPQPTPVTIPSPTTTVKPATVEDAPVVTKHSIKVGGKQLNYTVTTGFMPIKNAVSGDIEARVFFMAYTLDGGAAPRPLMFSFNGGPLFRIRLAPPRSPRSASH